MILDHIAFRVADREKALEFFTSALGYKLADEFCINFNDGSRASCYALNPPEKVVDMLEPQQVVTGSWDKSTWQLPPQIFVSDGTPGSIVDKWIQARGGVGGIHHIAFCCDDVEATMSLWKKKGWATFTTDKPISNEVGLTQCFTKPHPITGVVYEFIKRGKNNKGFNIENVRDLMESTNE